MGEPKLLLRWGATSIVGHLIDQWRILGAETISVVFGRGDQAITNELDRLTLPSANRICNPVPERGMFSSVQCAARWTGCDPALTHCAIVLGDQPHLRLETLRRLLDFTVQNPNRVCQPSYRGRARHPVLLPKVVLDELAVSKAATLKEALSTCQVALCACDDPGLDLDLNTPADYQAALALAAPKGAAAASGS